MLSHVVKNVSCEANKTSWLRAVQLTLKEPGKLIKRVGIWFANGTGNQVYVQIRKGGGILIPDPSLVNSDPESLIGDGVCAEGSIIEFPMESEIKNSETLEIWYINKDTIDTHDIMVIFTFETLPTEKSQLRS